MVAVGIVSVSVASILIRLAEAPALAIAAYRVGLAALLVAPYFILRYDAGKEQWSRQAVCLTLLSGVFLALHFVCWIHSLKMTSVASSVTLVSTTPLFAALFSFFWLDEKLNRRIIQGIVLTLVGSLFIAGTDFSFSGQALIGDVLALLGAVMASGYFLAGQLARRSLGLTAYIFLAYGVAALVLLLSCFFTNTPLRGFSAETYLVLSLLAVVPQLIGHSTFNWTLKFLSATIVAVLILGEPIGATILALFLLGETVAGLKVIGLLVLGTGILLCSLAVAPKRDGTERQS